MQEWDGRRLLSTTYAELRREADGFAAALAEEGVRTLDYVAILMPNGKPWVAAYMAVQRLGARVKRWTGLNAGRALFRALHRRVFGGMQLRFCMSGGPHVMAGYYKDPEGTERVLCEDGLRSGAFRELAKSGMKEACPLKNEFRFETAYSANRDSLEPLWLRLQD